MLSSQELVQFRRDLHSYPETGWCEFVTTFKVVQKLRSFGIEPKFGRQIINPEFVAGRNEKAVERGGVCGACTAIYMRPGTRSGVII